MKNLSWNTAVSGLLTILAVVLYWFGIIDMSQLVSGMGILAGAGLILSKDGEIKSMFSKTVHPDKPDPDDKD